MIMGHYPTSDMDIVWDCVEKSDSAGTAAYLSKEGIVAMPFVRLASGQNANKFKNCYYPTSDLKAWLEEEFLEAYFKPEERTRIKSVRIPAINDIVRWFPLKESRVCAPSYAAKENGAEEFCSYHDSKTCVYWLADTGRKQGMSASVVMADGKIYKSAYLAAENVCVRPVIEIAGGTMRWD